MDEKKGNSPPPDYNTGSSPPLQQQQQPPPPAGYPQQPPPPAGYHHQQPPPAGYPQQPPPAGYPQQPPPPMGYQPQMGQQYHPGTNTVIINQPLKGPEYGPSPATCTCPHCHVEITTTTSKKCSAMVWIVCGVICLIGLFFIPLWLGCCLIPFCIPPLYDTQHKCPNCEKEIAIHHTGGMKM